MKSATKAASEVWFASGKSNVARPRKPQSSRCLANRAGASGVYQGDIAMGPRRACLIAVVSSLFVPTAVLARRSGAHFGMLEGGVVEWKPGNQQAARKAPRRILAVPISFLF